MSFFNNVLKSTGVIFFITLGVCFKSGASLKDYLNQEIQFQTIEGLDCTDCPLQATVVERTLSHSGQHYLGAPLLVLSQAIEMMRRDRSTSIYEKVDGLEFILKQALEMKVRFRASKRTNQALEKGEPSIGYEGTFGDEFGEATFVWVVCRSETCDDDAGGIITKRAFKRAEVISIYPICGKEVTSLPNLHEAMRKLKGGPTQIELDQDARMRFKIKEKACESSP